MEKNVKENERVYQDYRETPEYLEALEKVKLSNPEVLEQECKWEKKRKKLNFLFRFWTGAAIILIMLNIFGVIFLYLNNLPLKLPFIATLVIATTHLIVYNFYSNLGQNLFYESYEIYQKKKKAFSDVGYKLP